MYALQLYTILWSTYYRMWSLSSMWLRCVHLSYRLQLVCRCMRAFLSIYVPPSTIAYCWFMVLLVKRQLFLKIIALNMIYCPDIAWFRLALAHYFIRLMIAFDLSCHKISLHFFSQIILIFSFFAFALCSRINRVYIHSCIETKYYCQIKSIVACSQFVCLATLALIILRLRFAWT